MFFVGLSAAAASDVIILAAPRMKLRLGRGQRSSYVVAPIVWLAVVVPRGGRGRPPDWMRRRAGCSEGCMHSAQLPHPTRRIHLSFTTAP
ncbi:unnamed protein product [Colias eurytheme]|nr:unnamed protein product [Colias eurytheme]